jgi:CheY-like chemotaxis protein
MDMRMPVMDGREASRRIKGSPHGRDTIIIALTASSFKEERADILASGCDDFLRKPFEEDELFELMQMHLGLSFIYQDDAVAIRDARAQVDSASMAALPDDVRASLERALIRLDSEAVATAIAEMPAPLAHALETLAHEFQYSKMLQLIQGAKGKG